MKTLRHLLAVSALALVPAAAFAQAPAPVVDDKSDKVVVVDDMKGEPKKDEGDGKRRRRCNPTPTSPSILGPTGYILTPNAEIAGGGKDNVAVAMGYDLVDNDTAFGQGAPNTNYYKVNLGLFRHLEVGGAFTHINGFGTFDTSYLNVKANVFSPCSPFQLAGGAIDAARTSNIAGNGLATEYVTGSLNVGRWVSFFPTLRVGAGWQTKTPLGVFPVAADAESIFVNGGLMVGKYLEIVGEWINVYDVAGEPQFVNLGGRLHFGGLEVHGYVMNVTEDALGPNIIPVYGASYTFVPKKKKRGGRPSEPEMKGEPKGGKEEVVPVVPVPGASSGLRHRLASNLLSSQ
jgi:hypothetical protein